MEMTHSVITVYDKDMARWDPDARVRLRSAAMALFAEHGYDAVTVTQIAERAGLTRRSFFRYFVDKREVLFDGSERLPPAVTEAIEHVDASTPPVAAAIDAWRLVGVALLREVDGARERRVIITASAELQERERTKLAELADATAEGLRRRGVDDGTARLIGRVAIAAFDTAFERSIDDEHPADVFPACLDEVVAELGRLADEARTPV